MFNPFDHEDANLEEAIATAYEYLQRFNADEEEHQKTVDQLSKLYALKNQNAQLNLQAQASFAAHQLECDKNAWKEEQDDLPFHKRISPDAAIAVTANLLVALIVVKYEERNVVSTKLLGFLRKI